MAGAPAERLAEGGRAPEASAESPAGLCAVLVPSCDAYSDLWAPFFALFWRFWPDCPFPVYLGANAGTFDHPRVIALPSNQGTNWANRVREHVAAVPTPYVLLVLEDFFWRRPTPTGEVLSLLQALRRLDGEMLRLTNRPPPDHRVPGYPAIGRIDPGAPFRASTQAAIWRRATLLHLLAPGESIWEFEVGGSRRSDQWPDGFYSTWDQVLPYAYHVVEKGKWFRHEARRFARMGIGCDFAARPVMTRSEALGTRMDWTKSWFLHRLPWRTRLRVQALARRLGV
jgi:hypothetical protein